MMEDDMFRKRDLGNGVEASVNSHAGTGNYYVDRSRLRTREVTEYVPNANPGKEGKYATKTETASIMDNARQAAGAMRMKSSFANRDGNDRNYGDECCAPSPWWGGAQNPLNRRRGDE
jgi:hypothetical protein